MHKIDRLRDSSQWSPGWCVQSIHSDGDMRCNDFLPNEMCICSIEGGDGIFLVTQGELIRCTDIHQRRIQCASKEERR